MNKSVVAVFENRPLAEAAQKQLVTSGFPMDRVELILGTDAGPSPGGKPVSGRADSSGSGIGDFFRSMFGMDDDEPMYYEEAARRGHATLIVHADSEAEADRARSILNGCSVMDIEERGREWRGEMPGKQAGDRSTGARGAEASIPVIEESLQVGKREVESGRVRVYTRVLERPVEASVNLREEHARVSRETVNRPATEADLKAFKEGSMEIRERAEVPVVEKQTRVVEEVHVGKQVEERTETVRDKVRKTDVQVEETPTASKSDPRKTPAKKPR